MSLLDLDQPAIVIEPLNAYRVKEEIPLNYGEFKTPIGEVEIMQEGNDISLVSYGSTLNIVYQVAKEIRKVGIECEVIDLQALIPFDISKNIVESIKKTNRVLFVDEDVPGGATAYMLQKVIEEQKAYYFLDSEPKTLSAKPHRPAYGEDGDYFSKPNVDDVFDMVYKMMNEVNPNKFPSI